MKKLTKIFYPSLFAVLTFLFVTTSLYSQESTEVETAITAIEATSKLPTEEKSQLMTKLREQLKTCDNELEKKLMAESVLGCVKNGTSSEKALEISIAARNRYKNEINNGEPQKDAYKMMLKTSEMTAKELKKNTKQNVNDCFSKNEKIQKQEQKRAHEKASAALKTQTRNQSKKSSERQGSGTCDDSAKGVGSDSQNGSGSGTGSGNGTGKR